MTKLILLVGIPGSGKTTYARQLVSTLPNAVHLSSDEIRRELYGDEAVQKDHKAVFEIMHTRTVSLLQSSKTVIFDATNLTKRDRASTIAKVSCLARIEAHVMHTAVSKCIDRDAKRERSVGSEVIYKCFYKFQYPSMREGIDYIKIVET